MRKSSPPHDPTDALLSVALDRAAREPLGRQLYVQLRDLILAGRITSGARMPSTRKLCLDLQASRTVTVAAYDQLTLEGYLHGRPGSGHFVSPLDHIRGSEDREARDLAVPPAESALPGAPFSPTCPPADLFPNRTWARLLARGWRKHGSVGSAMPWAGLPALRAALANHVYSVRGLKCRPDQILVTSGNADALRIIARTLAPSASGARPRAWVEDPGYIGSRRELLREGFELIPIPVDAEGADVGVGIARAPDADLALLTPARQFPLGMPLSLARRLQLLNWARDKGAVVIEDDYDSEIRFTGRAVPSLSTLDPDAAILSLGSLSKLTFEGLRLGYVTGPSRLIERIARTRESERILVPTSAQAAFAEFISSGLFAKHLRQLRVQLNRRRKALIEALDEHVGEMIRVLPQEVGMHLTIVLTRAASGGPTDVEIASAAAGEGLYLEPLSGFSNGGPLIPGFLLGYAAWPEPALAAAVRHLAQILRSSGAAGS